MPNKKTLLLIDDDAFFGDLVKEVFIKDNILVKCAQSLQEGLSICAAMVIDIVLLDQMLPDGDGHEICPQLLQYNESCKIIFTTAYPTFDNAVLAIKSSAFDYLPKPMEVDELRLAVFRALRTVELERVKDLNTYKEKKACDKAILNGEEFGLKEVSQIINLAANSNAPVVITGETGVGKNVVARCIHYRGSRQNFIEINCATLPENLIEAELFGYEKGAFTGAVSAKKGIFEMAEGGTLLLDEIGELPIALQSKLLTVLEDGKIKRLGSETIRTVDVRVIASTNVDLKQAVKNKCFREDLYYRLHVLQIQIPPLRERKQDIGGLCEHLFFEIASINRKLADDDLSVFEEYPWPGNVRELKNILERSLILGCKPSSLIEIPEKPLINKRMVYDVKPHLAKNIRKLKDVEKEHILFIVDNFFGNLTHAAYHLGISLSTLKRRMQSFENEN